MRLSRYFKFLRPNNPPLVELDELYAKTMLELSVATRLDYCQRLLSRSKFELKQIRCRQKRKQLETLIKSTLTEISKMESTSNLRSTTMD
ncbi:MULTISPECIES: hypothetical protein [Maribacter]|uniref:Uncharacterized protein n=1 Tax=Maribacter flavus TaxID=1658664 RepID=A0A5B2TU95_9FLAO|nr:MULTISPECIES: hypothetical protein [Maribacter]KAA2217210.1 hypothetical protein F0361_14725 [Maribacter flavus]MDC6407075.1 hypothetical protein [Maribacter sp. PR66]MEE1974222.1 hypothetical protein [Maribacter flavus]